MIVTGGAVFSSSVPIRYLLRETEVEIMDLDKLMYSGDLASLREVENSPRYHFTRADICDGAGVARCAG